MTVKCGRPWYGEPCVALAGRGARRETGYNPYSTQTLECVSRPRGPRAVVAEVRGAVSVYGDSSLYVCPVVPDHRCHTYPQHIPLARCPPSAVSSVYCCTL